MRNLSRALTPSLEHPDVRSDLVHGGVDCISFSGLNDASWARILALPSVQEITRSSHSFDRKDYFARFSVWDGLTWVGIVQNGLTFSNYEDAATNVFKENECYVFENEVGPSEFADGLFFDNGTETPLFEAGFGSIKAIRDMGPRTPFRVRKSPLSQAFESLDLYSADKISKMDSADSASRASLGEPVDQFPDIKQVEQRLRQYCLNKAHRDRKYRGFAFAGYHSEIPGHVEMVARFICSAFYEQPTIEEARTTANHGIQFSVPIAMPRTDGGLVRVNTAWIGGRGEPLHLASAYRSEHSGESSPVTRVPQVLSGSADWQEILDHATGCAQLIADQSEAGGYPFYRAKMWLDNRDPRTREFARWVRHNTTRSNGRFNRKEYGRGATLVSILPQGHSEIAAHMAANKACTILRLLEITASPQVYDF